MLGFVGLSFLLLIQAGNAQESDAGSAQQKAPTVADQAEKRNSARDLRRLQDDEFLVETAYLQDESDLFHKLTFERTGRHSWSAVFKEELTIGNENRNFVFSIPAHLVGTGTQKSRGFGDAEIEFSYGLYGNGSSRITISPGIGLSLPTGSVRKELGSGGAGLSVKLPVSVAITEWFTSNSIVEFCHTRSARNTDGQSANTSEYAIGQSFVWFAKPKLNFLVETVWERQQEVTGHGSTVNSHSFLVSPAVRWAYEFKGGLTVSPGVAIPIGLGPSRGENNILFYIAFSHPIRKRHDETK